MTASVSLRIARLQYDEVRRHLFSSYPREEAAIIVAGECVVGDHTTLLAREIIPVPNDAYQTKEGLFMQVSAEFLSGIIKRCRREDATFLLAHSHPFSTTHVGFSGIDDGGEAALVPKLEERLPGRIHGFLVFGHESVAARAWHDGRDRSRPLTHIDVVGEQVERVVPSNAQRPKPAPIQRMHARQALAIGDATQRRLYDTTVVVIGAGGLGSQVCIQLVHTGVRRIIVIDDDILEETNRGRVLVSTPADVETTDKVEIIKRYAATVNPAVEVVALSASILEVTAQAYLREADVILCCTDTIASRAAINRVAYQYLLPVIDIGMDVQLGDDGTPRASAGRVMLLYPDGPCLECMGIVSGEALDREAGTRPCSDDEPPRTGPAPSAIFLNGVVASLAVTRLVDLLGGWQKDRPLDRYEMFLPLSGTLKSFTMTPTIKCTLCRELRGLGDALALPGGPPPTNNGD